MLQNDMNIQSVKLAYMAPNIELFLWHEPLNLLVAFSGSGSVEDWEDEGEELQYFFKSYVA